jgi:pyridoxine 4-dehydrogenase
MEGVWLIIPIPGAKNARQAGENIGAVGWRLEEEEMARIEKAAK